ncbi:MAG TPA: hypothetical protein VLT33_44665 [Labilithrix sp.]|nr:hypothetical protein [Labilithrix sp.]
MGWRLVLLGGAAIGLATGCAVQQLPAVSPPARTLPADLDLPAEPPAAGTGRVILETNGEPAKVVEITSMATATTNGEDTATVVGVRPLCTTPCVVDLPYGSHPLVMHSLSDETHQSEIELEVGARAKVFRHALGERRNGGVPQTVGASLLTLGLLAATTGAILWVAGSANSSALSGNGQMLTAFGAGGVVLSIPFLILGRPTERAGATTQWTLPGPPPAPTGAELDRL